MSIPYCKQELWQVTVIPNTNEFTDKFTVCHFCIPEIIKPQINLKLEIMCFFVHLIS